MVEFIPSGEDFFPSIEITNSGIRYGLLHKPFINLYNALWKTYCIYH